MKELNERISSIKKSLFENKIKPSLQYIGAIGAVITGIAYLILICVMIFGFKAQSVTQTLTFAIANGIAGLIIMQFMKIQGISFAKNLAENIPILEKYNRTKTKDKKTHSIKYYWITSLIKDILVKALSIVLFTASIIYIVIEGSGNYALLAMAVVNLLMFICFGMLSLVSSYDFFNERHIPYVIEKLEEINLEKEIKHDNTSEWRPIEESSGAGSEEQAGH